MITKPAKENRGSIQIHDAKTIKPVPAYRVKSIGKNGELLQSSEVLNSVQAVGKNIGAMLSLYGVTHFKDAVWTYYAIQDHTKDQKFASKIEKINKHISGINNI